MRGLQASFVAPAVTGYVVRHWRCVSRLILRDGPVHNGESDSEADDTCCTVHCTLFCITLAEQKELSHGQRRIKLDIPTELRNCAQISEVARRQSVTLYERVVGFFPALR